MQLLIATNQVPITLVVGIRTKTPTQLVINVSSIKKRNTSYFNRVTVVDGYREFDLQLPQSPRGARITIYNPEVGNVKPNQDPTFSVEKFTTESLQTCPINLKPDQKSFIKLAQMFSENAGILTATKKDGEPSIYRSNDGKFQIDYYNQIVDKKSGQLLTTPARIGHSSGIIEVSRKDFRKYTVPMRMIILLHEYNHKYGNPKINKPIAYETGADILALSMYLSLGYSPAEAHYAFLRVFKDSNHSENVKRYKIINDFIDKFTNGEIEGSCKLKTNISGSK